VEASLQGRPFSYAGVTARYPAGSPLCQPRATLCHCVCGYTNATLLLLHLLLHISACCNDRGVQKRACVRGGSVPLTFFTASCSSLSLSSCARFFTSGGILYEPTRSTSRNTAAYYLQGEGRVKEAIGVGGGRGGHQWRQPYEQQ